MASTFQEVLRELRGRAAMTQEDLAGRSGVSVRTIRGFERGERTNPQTATVKLLADALALSANEQKEFFALAAGPEKEDSSGEVAASPAEPIVPRRPRQSDHLALAAEELAMGVGIRLRRAYEHQQMHDPFPLPVRWTHVSGVLSDHAGNIHAQPDGEPAADVDLVGGFGQIAEIYRRVPSGRLVVLGDGGSGKTMLATRLTLDLLREREQAQPVPVTVSVASWDPTRSRFRDWLSGLLIRDHPGLARTTSGGLTLSAALVETDMILPVLDGFDEIAKGLRGPALQALNRAALPVVLTSRPAEYEDAVTVTDVLTAAAVVRLGTLTPADLAHYLPRATRGNPGTAPGAVAETRWHPVVAELTADTPGPGARNVNSALSTPLMVSLARSIYSDTPGRDPADLLDTDRFPTAAAVEDHLLGSYVPALYGDRSSAEANGRDQDWHLDQVLRWLNYLARHGITRQESGIAWWGLGTALPIWSRAIVVGLVSLFTITLVYVVIGAPLSMVIYGGAFADTLRLQFVNGFLNASVAGPVLGLAYGLVHHFRVITPVPSRIRVRIGRGLPPGAIPLAQVRTRVVTAFIGGLVFGGAVGALGAVTLHSTMVSTLSAAAELGAMFGGMFSIAAAAAIGLVSWFESPADADSAASPVDSVKTNRDAVLTQMLLGGLIFGLVVGLGTYATGDVFYTVIHDVAPRLTDGISFTRPANALGAGILNWFFGALAYAVTLTAWGQWAILARLWLPLTGRLPWRLLVFLEDAYQRGVLRQSGPVWEFRHDRLQRHLAETGPRTIQPRPDQR
ncbi:helix-turn-helix domain-containing protein [Amycolatopsis sp. NBC_00345]|uniref:helix-turn-helix domain-containing protein n=1 Tax=Amycolatopsis sp. NBC_00345 TaxID=2975955 RepID=UPI002E2749CD